jgi:F-type H+-transporting ATPase subunit delta
MSARSISRRYAVALFDVARKAGSEEKAGRDLSELVRLIGGHAELSRVLSSPAVPATAKRDIIGAVMAQAGDLSAEVRRMVTMLADRDRLAALPQLAAAYAELLLDAQRIVTADVVTATALTDASRAALSAALGRATGKSVRLTERVDPAIVGGVVARVGSFVYDGSVTRQLERMRDKLNASN